MIYYTYFQILLSDEQPLTYPLKTQTDTKKNIFEKLKATTLAEIYQDSRFRLPISV